MMRKAREYLILCGAGVEELTNVVNEHIEQRWKPKGGPFVFEGSVCQAVVRKEKAIKLDDQRLRKNSED